MTDTSTLASTVTDIVATELGRTAAELSPDRDLRSAEGADSIKVLRMISRIEQAYGVELEDDAIFGLKTIDDIVTAVGGAIARERG